MSEAEHILDRSPLVSLPVLSHFSHFLVSKEESDAFELLEMTLQDISLGKAPLVATDSLDLVKILADL